MIMYIYIFIHIYTYICIYDYIYGFKYKTAMHLQSYLFGVLQFSGDHPMKPVPITGKVIFCIRRYSYNMLQ